MRILRRTTELTTTSDDWIDGYKIPKGSVIFINAWGMHHDEKYFPNPDVFDPDHYKGVTALASELAQAPNPLLWSL